MARPVYSEQIVHGQWPFSGLPGTIFTAPSGALTVIRSVQVSVLTISFESFGRVFVQNTAGRGVTLFTTPNGFYSGLNVNLDMRLVLNGLDSIHVEGFGSGTEVLQLWVSGYNLTLP